MAKHANCCVPGCTNNYRTKHGLSYYRIPKDKKLRRQYKILIRNATLKLDADNTRICGDHFGGGHKRSRLHLPSIFPWSKHASTRRVLKRVSPEKIVKKSRICKKNRRLASLNKDHSEDTLPESDLCQTEDVLLTSDQGMQTDFYEQVQNKDESLQTECYETVKVNFGTQTELLRFDINQFKDKDSDIAFYTGFPNYKTLMLCFDMVKDAAKNISYGNYDRKCFDCPPVWQPGRPRILTTFQEFVLVLMRLRLGLFERDLAHRFEISESTVSVIFRTWIRFLRLELQELIITPPRDVLQEHMPKLFKEFYPKTALIIDCTEIQMERPSALDNQSSCYSSYKSRTTMKSLVGITPSGVIGFASELYPGSITDKEITVKSGFLALLEQDDEIMADKGFLIQDELAAVGATLIIPAFLKGKQQFSKEEGEKNKKVASLRVHVERCMERIKNWHILDKPIPVSLAGIASDIFIVIAALTNFHPPLIS